MTTTPKLTLPIEIGKRYVRRDGVIVAAQESGIGRAEVLAYIGGGGVGARNFSSHHVYRESGLVHTPGPESERDLVADFIEAAAHRAVEHPYAHILRWVADGETVQWQESAGAWQNQSPEETLSEISTTHYAAGRYRLAPRTIQVNGREVPAPMTEAPKFMESYWVPNPTAPRYSESWAWLGDDLNESSLARGIAHATQAGAIAHAKAWLGIE